MRLLLLPLAVIALVACSKSDNLTLSCYGTKIQTEAGQETITPETTHTYKFQNLKFDNYDCATHENIISCNFINEANGTRERKRIIYDTQTSSFVEIIAKWAIGEKIKQDERAISRKEFIGLCQKPIFN
jgi:phosphopentomutase